MDQKTFIVVIYICFLYFSVKNYDFWFFFISDVRLPHPKNKDKDYVRE